MIENYEQIQDPYDPFLMRGRQSAVPNGQFASERGNGSVMEQPVKSDGDSADVWIKNFIRSSNWNPKKNGFYIDGRTGYAEFTNVYVSGTITASTITGSEISGTNITGGTINGGAIVGGTITGGIISGGSIYGTSITGGTITGTTIIGGTVSTSGGTSKITLDGSTDSITFFSGGTHVASIISYASGAYSGLQIKTTDSLANVFLTSASGLGRLFVGTGMTSILLEDWSTTNHMILYDADWHVFGAGPSGNSLVDFEDAGMLLIPVRAGSGGASWERPSTFGPADPDGLMYYDSSNNELMVLKNGTWRTVTTS